MKFLNEDGTIEDGTPFTDEQVRIYEVLHELICRHSTHYSFQGVPKCVNIAARVGEGVTLLNALEELANPKPKPSPEDEHPLPHPTGVEA
jgi:hypothetical protein